MTKNYVGIDVCEKKLDIFIHPSKEYVQFNNTQQGIMQLYEYLKAFDIELIVLEATGKLEALCADILMDLGYKVSVVNPARVCYYRKSLGYKAKTDLIDAEVIARFAEALRPDASHPSSATERRLRELSARRKQLVILRDSERNRLRRVRDEYAKEDLQINIAFLNERLHKIETIMVELIKQNKAKKEVFDILQSIPGIGEIMALTLMSYLPELGQLNQKQIASLAGVFPLNMESGSSKGHRKMCWSGRPKIRSTLYLATLVGIRHNSFIRSKFNDLVAKGKAKKVAMGACMRKLIIIANSMIKEKRCWHD